MEGVKGFLYLCDSAGIRKAIVSNLSFSGGALIERIGEILPEFDFEFILASSESVFRKPSRRIFERALALAGLEAEDCWFIGDDVVCDIEGRGCRRHIPRVVPLAAKMHIQKAGGSQSPL